MLATTFYKKKLADAQFYNTISFKDIEKPITILLGPNGTGKSMTLRGIERACKIKGIKLLSYSTSKDDIVSKGSPAFGDWDPWKLAQAFTSEGERMTSSFFDFVNTDFLREVMTNKEPLVVIVDEADSGLSFDRLYETLTQMLFVVKEEHKKKRDIKVILTCNSYEMYEILRQYNPDTFWLPTCKKVEFKSYKTFKKPYMEYYKNVHKVLLDME